jgi:cytoplasmic iron level regulating protein YaaA (DUF328/UPF0246 family)
MLTVISPSKTLDFNPCEKEYKIQKPYFIKESLDLISELKKLNVNDIKKLMNISDKLAELNHQRFLNFSEDFNIKNSKPAIFAFKGDVYEGFDANSLNEKEIEFANKKIAILSGLYGLLKPLDFIKPYRLEMGINFKYKKNSSLYEFWGNKISEKINELENEYLINLASNEYFTAVNKKILKPKIIDISFKEYKKGKLSVIGLFAKKAAVSKETVSRSKIFFIQLSLDIFWDLIRFPKKMCTLN